MAFDIKRVLSKLNIKTLFKKPRPKLAQYKSKDFPVQLFLSANRPTISVCVLTKDCASTIDNTLSVLDDCLANGYIDQVVVVDAHSQDGTPEIARRHEAQVFGQDDLLSQFGPTLGKGDAMWRAQSVLTGDIVVYQDGDLYDYAMRHVLGVIGPLLKYPKLSFVKGTYRRHLRSKGTVVKDGGGRVSTLTARPLLKAFYPELHEFRQPLQELGAMAETITQTILSRVFKEGRYDSPIESPVERPAFISLQNSSA